MAQPFSGENRDRSTPVVPGYVVRYQRYLLSRLDHFMNRAIKHPSVTVLLPVHNAAQYVGEAIESILAQTFKDFELLIIDDGSTDETPAILERYARLDPRIRLVCREARGLVATLNEGIGLARGEWIARMDADDVSVLDRLSRQLDFLKTSAFDFCGGAIECVGGWKTIWTYPTTPEGCEVQLLFGVPFAHPAIVGRRTAFAQLGYRSEFMHCEDYDLWQRAWAEGMRMANVPQVVLRYRIHSGQVTTLHRLEQAHATNIVRERHWRALLSFLSDDKSMRIIDVIGRGHGRSDDLLPALKHLLCRYPPEAKEIILFNSFRVFARLAKQDSQVLRNWISLITATQTRLLGRNWGRASVLFLLSALGIDKQSSIYVSMRRAGAVINSIIYWLKSKIK